MTRHLLLLAGMLALTAAQAGAAPRTEGQLRAAALQAINQQRQTRRLAPATEQPALLAQGNAYQILGHAEGGFAVVATDDLAPEVLGVSLAPYSQGRNQNFEWWLKAMDEVVQNAVTSGRHLAPIAPDSDRYPTSVEPMVTTLWDQDTPYDGMCPTYSGSTRCLTGCVATAMAQVLNYHKTPEHGYGQRTIYYGSQAVTANFAEDYYDWDHMRNSYTGGNYTSQEAEAVALLMRDCGVAANMEYGGPNEGSGAYSQDAAEGLRKYFGFTNAQCLERDHYQDAQWMDRVFFELSENGPLYYAGADWSQGGHAFVLHGYRADGKVYVNWGWSGEDDGYYDISLLNPSGYSFSYGQDMITGITSDNHAKLGSGSVQLQAEGSLQAAVEALDSELQLGSLVVSGPLNKADLYYLRQLAGRDSLGGETEGRLRMLDLSAATLPQNQLPDSLFKNCRSLQRVMLPPTLERIGRQAFYGCTAIYEMRVPTHQVPALSGSGVFEGLPFGSARLYVRSGMKTKFQQAAQWKEFGANSISEFGTSVKVRNAIRKYGQQNPQFTYTVSGDAIEGTPELSCEATASSPAGRYPVTIKRGTVVGDAVDFIDGYLVVQKIEATATVGNYTREQFQPNPEFHLVAYEGLINGDTKPVWLKEPVITTTADEQSPLGEYPIIVESAEAESYELSYVAGTLTVTQSTGIAGVQLWQEAAPQRVFTLDGRRANGQQLPKGIYVVDGKKRLVK